MTAPPLAFLDRLGRQSTHLFHWTADDGDVTLARTGQVLTYSRASGDTVVTSTATVNVGYGQPRWLHGALGAALLCKPTVGGVASDVFTGTCDFLLQPLTIYVAGYCQASTGTISAYLLRLGTGGASKGVDLVTVNTTGGFGNTTAQYFDGSGNPSVTLSGTNPVAGDYVEYCIQLDAAYKLTVIRSVNGAADQVSSLSSAGAVFAGGFNGTILKISDAANAAFFGYREVVVTPGVYSMAQMRALPR